MRTPEFRKASSRSRCSSVAYLYSMLVKVAGEAWNLTRVPFAPFGRADDRKRLHRLAHLEAGEMLLPSRQIVSSSQSDSALTTETPTPCRPPETL